MMSRSDGANNSSQFEIGFSSKDSKDDPYNAGHVSPRLATFVYSRVTREIATISNRDTRDTSRARDDVRTWRLNQLDVV